MRPRVLTKWVSPKMFQYPNNMETGFYWDQLRGRARRSCVTCYNEVLETHSIAADWLIKTALFNIGEYECTGIPTDEGAWGSVSAMKRPCLLSSSSGDDLQISWTFPLHTSAGVGLYKG